ncbi:MAG: hypothetical protein AAB895_03975 [Patescibacteria group bacterium]
MKLYDVIRKEQPKEEEPLLPHTFVPTEHPRKKRRHIVFFAIVLTVLTGLYIVGLQFSRATVFIEERTIPFSLEKTVISLPHETQSDSERLSFQTMTVTTDIKREIFGSELVHVTGKAKGTAVFFNEYSKTAQTIKTGTSLTGSNGKKYVTSQSVTIPGYTIDTKKKKIPGTTIAIPVVAVETGGASNSEGLSFTITSFSGTKKTQLYARSAGALIGGEAGMRHTVSDAERPALMESLKTQLTERLKRETRAQIPPHLITYPDLQFVSIDTDSLKLEGEGVKFTAQIKGTMVSYLISRSLFESAIAKEVLSDKEYTTVSIPGLASLSVVPESAIPADPKTLPDTISIRIAGSDTIITKAPISSIQEALLGSKRRSFDATMGIFPEIAGARFNLFPFWAPFFPKQDKYIKVILE